MNRFLIQNIIFTKNYYYIVLKGLLKVLKIFEILGILFDFIESTHVDRAFIYATIFYCSRALLVNQNYIVYINMKQDADTLKKTHIGGCCKVYVGAVHVCALFLSMIVDEFIDLQDESFSCFCNADLAIV